MKQIGFKNFRKFENFPIMDFSPITIFVGENNAGKSTVVKAILSVLDFISSQYFHFEKNENDKSILDHKFYFNTSYFAHIGTFSRALYNHSKENVITFILTESNVKFEIEIEGNPNDEEAISGKIKKLSITILKWNIDLIYDFLNDNLKVLFHKEKNKLYDFNEENNFFSLRKSNSKTIEKYFKTVPDNAELQMPISEIKHKHNGIIGGPLILMLIEIFSSQIETFIESKEEIPYFKNIPSEVRTFIKQNHNLIIDLKYFGFPYFFMSNRTVEYIYAHAVAQTVIYSAKDTNDYFVKTIHEFANMRISNDSIQHKFITIWMKRFNIGEDYEIKSVGGEAHIVKIIEKDKAKVNLADKGMGSIQLMILLFRLATKMDGRNPLNKHQGLTIIIEEPEQNLHPKLQSKLADLFLELNTKYGFKFIIETHSEYLIRRSQVIVSEKYNSIELLEKNPFKVYYFPSEGNPYNVIYRPDGKFKNNFGKGFFDEASNLAFKLF